MLPKIIDASRSLIVEGRYSQSVFCSDRRAT